jgi:hypothetical protein
MNNYKITNLSSGKVHLMNEEEKTNFFRNIRGTDGTYIKLKQINKYFDNGNYKYKVENLTERKNQRIDNFLNFVAYVSIIAVSMLMTALYINTYC